MKHNVALTVASLLALLFMSFHLTHDVIRQAEGAVTYPIPVLVFALWLFGGLFGAGMIIVHATGIVVGKSGGFFFVWTLIALSTTGWVTMILAARGLWTTLRARRAAQLGGSAS